MSPQDRAGRTWAVKNDIETDWEHGRYMAHCIYDETAWLGENRMGMFDFKCRT